MNRLKCNEGGQPVYLDDLETLQANDMQSMALLLAALTGSEGAYLLQEQKGEVADDEGKQMKMYGGAAVVNGEIVKWGDTTLTVDSWDDPLYLCIRRTDADQRTFEDGQTRACATKTEGYLSTNNSGTTESYLVTSLPVMSNLVRKAIGIKEEAGYRQLKVSFMNGYSGTVAVKELTDVYRYKIDIKSTNTTTLTGSVSLFYSEETLPGARSEKFVTPTTAFVCTENGVTAFTLSCAENTVTADVELPCDDVVSASGLSVKMIFELPK